MANSPTGLRQDKTRRMVMGLETTSGTLETSNLYIFPARAGSRLTVSDAEPLSNSEALDGYAGEVSATRGALGVGGTLVTEIRDYGGTTAFPPFVRQLLASGFEASYSTPNLTLTPSTKAVTNWPGETAGDRSPASCTISEILIDNNTADERKNARGCLLNTKLVLGTNQICTVESEIIGLVQNGELIDVSTTDLSGVGTRFANEGSNPIVFKNITATTEYVDSSGSTAFGAYRLKSLEIDLNSNIVRQEDPSAADGFAVGAVFSDEAPTVSWEFADTSAIAEDVYAGFYSQAGWFNFTITITTNSASSRALTITIPRVQYSVEATNSDGARAFAITGKAVREKAGDSTAPITITWDHGT